MASADAFGQIDIGCCAWDGTSEKKADQKSILSVQEVVPPCTVGGGKIDVSLMGSKLLEKGDRKGVVSNNVLLRMLEVKKII
jgi:hypothetical protein